MNQALDDGDADAFRRAAHSLKSNSESFGATRLATLARELEAMGREGRLDEARPKMPLLESTYEEAAQALKALL
jgi:HPt (histidine-containing phosphotransfer) domain-containing protein